MNKNERLVLFIFVAITLTSVAMGMRSTYINPGEVGLANEAEKALCDRLCYPSLSLGMKNNECICYTGTTYKKVNKK